MTTYWLNRCPTSAGPDVAPLSSSALDPEGIFAIVNALRPVEGFGGSAKILLAFSPQACKEYYEVLAIRCGGRAVWCSKRKAVETISGILWLMSDQQVSYLSSSQGKKSTVTFPTRSTLLTEALKVGPFL